MTSSATIEWKPGPQVGSMTNEKVATPCAFVVTDELPLISMGSWRSWVRTTRVEGAKCLSVKYTGLPTEAGLGDSVRVGNPPDVVLSWCGWLKATLISIPSTIRASSAKMARTIKTMRKREE